MAESARLSIFISYSTEDEVFATKIGEELRRAFNPAVLKIALAAEFSLGTAWREQIEDDLDSADVLIIIATGQQKLSHSFLSPRFYVSRVAWARACRACSICRICRLGDRRV